MVTLSDPTWKRLVDVNPAPDHLELPPISDVALYESIAERARSGESPFQPVRGRSWRPGVVVAAVAFAVVLTVAGAIGLLSGMFAEKEGPVATEPPAVTTVAPAPTTLPPAVTTTPPETTTAPSVSDQYEIVITDLDHGLFSASGAAVDEGMACAEGAIDIVPITREWANWDYSNPGAYPDDYWTVEERTLTCGDGSGSIVLGVRVDQSQLMSRYSFSGNWLVTAGTGAYERVAGGGRLTGGCDSDRANCSYEYTGQLDRSRETAVATIVPTPSGRHDVAISYDGGWMAGPFAATGSAVSSGHFCPDGRMMGSTPTDATGRGIWKHTFFCADGTGRLTLSIDAREGNYGGQDPSHTGTWTVNAGAGAYESVTGAGEISGECVGGIECSWTYTGYLEILE
jgi:hypothetical protein